MSFVLDGPPGTGKSQTIANIIADALSVGKRVLFVSEKVAALEVVKRRLDDCGLGDFCLECHSSKVNRKTVLEELKWCLEIPHETYPDPNPKFNELKKRRQALNDYVRILHQPQQPIGLSMYQLHGNIAKLTSSGMLGKSRIQFSEPELVTRSMLESWIELLRLAPQYQDVLKHFAMHPWRGCRLTSQTLALKSDIRRKFAALSDSAEQLVRDLGPLEEARLIPEDTTSTSLKSVIGSLEESLTIPEVPVTWFSSPREIARALLGRHLANLQAIQLRQSLPEYVEDVTSLFSDEIVPLSHIESCAWLERLTSRLPNNYEECRNLLVSYAQHLRDFEDALSTFEQTFKQLLVEIKLPIKSDIPLGSVGTVLSAAQVIAADAPLRTSWFQLEQTTEIVAEAKNAIARLESINTMEQAFKDRISSVDLLAFASAIKDVDKLRSSWN